MSEQNAENDAACRYYAGCSESAKACGYCGTHCLCGSVENDRTSTVWVVYCGKHRHYLAFRGVSGTTWRDDQAEAKRYDRKADAVKDARLATWLDHNPTPWAIAGTPIPPGAHHPRCTGQHETVMGESACVLSPGSGDTDE